MPAPRTVVLERKLLRAGHPVSGLSDNTPNGQIPSAATVTINFLPGATQEQIDAANAFKATFDFAPRQSLTRQEIAAGLAALTANQRNLVLAHCIAVMFRSGMLNLDYEDFLGLQGETGIELAVDEVVP